MIFIWSVPGDRQTAVVRDALSRLKAPCFFFNQHELLSAKLVLDVGASVSGRLQVGRRMLNLGDVTAAYLRPYETGKIPEVAAAEADSAAHRAAVELEDALTAWTELTPAFVVNRFSDMGPNGSKPYQASLIQEFGFRTPDTLITTDPKEVRAFLARHGSIIYKSISGVRSIVSRLSPRHDERLTNVRWCPTQFQEYVPGEDYRVHVVGERIFTSRIVSSADDYRYASRKGDALSIELAEVPADIAEQCRSMAFAMRLWVAGIDLRRTPKGEWYCFEVNPSPGFTYYQDACGFAMDEAIAGLLMTRIPSPQSSVQEV